MPSAKRLYIIQVFDLKIYQVTIRIQISKYTIDIPLKTISSYFIRSLELYRLENLNKNLSPVNVCSQRIELGAWCQQIELLQHVIYSKHVNWLKLWNFHLSQIIFSRIQQKDIPQVQITDLQLGVTIARKVLPHPQWIKASMRNLLNKGLFI